MENSGIIAKKMCAVMNEIKAISKDKRNPQGWNFRGIDDVYNELHNAMAKHGVFCLPTINGIIYREKIKNQKGSEGWHQIIEITYRFVAEDGSSIECKTWGESCEYGSDKLTNKCMSAAHKYALLQTFLIPVEDMEDPDKENPMEQQQQQQQQQRRRPDQQPQGQQQAKPQQSQQQQQPARSEKQKQIDDFINKAITYFTSKGISQEEIEIFLQCRINLINEIHFDALRGARQRIDAGENPRIVFGLEGGDKW